MVDRIVPAATEETHNWLPTSWGFMIPALYQPANPFRQWVIEDNFVNGRGLGQHRRRAIRCRRRTV